MGFSKRQGDERNIGVVCVARLANEKQAVTVQPGNESCASDLCCVTAFHWMWCMISNIYERPVKCFLIFMCQYGLGGEGEVPWSLRYQTTFGTLSMYGFKVELGGANSLTTIAFLWDDKSITTWFEDRSGNPYAPKLICFRASKQPKCRFTISQRADSDS
jgi:hypothetical protein